MANTFSRIVRDKQEAVAMIDSYIENPDVEVIAPVIRGMTTSNDEGTFAIMSGSGNELPPFEKLVVLFGHSGFLTEEEQDDAVLRNVRAERARRSSAAA